MANLPQSATRVPTPEFEEFLAQIADSAQVLTEASGVAIAIRSGDDRDGEEVLCVARRGDTAPPLGSRLSTDSGISGECLMTGSVLHCDDAATDHRVDPEVCRQLGIRSIVVLPVRGKIRTAGILEVFSTQPNAFTGKQIDSLKDLAEMIEMACASGPDELLLAQSPQNNAEVAAAPQAMHASWPYTQHLFPLSFLKGRRDYWIAGGGLAVILIIALISLAAFHSSGKNETAKKAAPVVFKPSLPETEEIVLGGSGTNADQPTTRARRDINSSGGLQRASKVESLKNTADATTIDLPPLRTSPVGSEQDSGQAPALPLAANSVTPEDLLTPAGAMPKLASSTSQGVSGGTLDYRVNPKYPPEARAMRLEGEVVLAAIVTKTGRVRDVKLVKGSPILARAAMDAVKQWRYQPYRLNGEPQESETEIRVQFHAQ
jgi:TonB family protein